MNQILEKLKCRECGKFLENTAGGNYATCPRLHGKLQLKLTRAEELIIDERRILHKFPVAKPVKGKGKRGCYLIDGREYKAKARFGFGSARRRLKKGKFVARCSRFVKGYGEFVPT